MGFPKLRGSFVPRGAFGGTLVEWNRLDRLKLSYFSTKRDRSDGWMQLTLGSAGGRTREDRFFARRLP